MATTSSGWTYDEPGDTVYTWPARSQTIAETLETRVGYGGLRLLATSAPSAVSSVSIESIFSSTHDHYLIEYSLDLASSSATLRFRMRASSTDDTSSNYYYAGTATESAVGYAGFGTVSTGGGWGRLELWHPGTAVATRFTSQVGSTITAPTAATWAGAHNVATAYTGITIYPSASTITGSIRVYGHIK